MAALPSLAALGLPPDTLARLPAAVQDRLLADINQARRLQAAEYETAFEQALTHVPALLRGTVRKIIAG